jgi:hypothetical protein
VGFLGLCKGDQVVDLLHDYFGANVLRVPEERIQPLTVVARRNGKRAFRGELKHLLVDDAAEELPPQVSKVAELSGKRTRSVELGLGLDILGGFLSGFGVPSAGIAGHFKGAKEISFRFADVQRRWIDPGLLGRRLDRNRIDRDSAAAVMYFGAEPWQLLVVDSIITSNQFTISATGSVEEDVEIDVPAIQEVVGQAKAKVAVTSGASSEVSFSGEQRLTFAFTLQRLYLEDSGEIFMIDPDDSFLSSRAAEGGVVPVTPRVLLSREPGLLEWDEPLAP